jgi:hypothetical protein
MAAPVSLTNAAAQSLDTIYSPAGTPGLKMGLGSVALTGLTPPGEWQAAATHVDGTTFGTGSDGVSVAGVKNAAGNAVALESSAAGTPSPTILTVQGDASGVPLPVALTLGTLSVEGLGTPGAQSGLLLTVQGDPSATPVPVSGALTVPTPDVFVPFSATVITTETTIWTPASGKKFRLMGYVISQGTLAGDVTLRDNTAGATILVIPANTVGVSQVSPPLGSGILSAVANNVLTAQGSATETISGYVFGVEV